jgi:hypothetical protein
VASLEPAAGKVVRKPKAAGKNATSGRKPGKTPRKKAARKAEGGSTVREEVVKLLSRAGGTSLPELMKAFKWQAHSVRGFISWRVESSHRGFHHKVARRQRSWELNSNLVAAREAGREGRPYDSSRRTTDRHRQLQRYVVSPNGENRGIMSGICWSEPGTPQSQDVARFSCNEAGAERGVRHGALSG